MSHCDDTLLETRNLTCIREDRVLFEALNFTVKRGDIIQVEGPNGAGKTSLLRILAGLSSPYEGQVYFAGKPIRTCEEYFHQNMLYLGHQVGVKDELTAEENLAFSLALHGLPIQKAEETLSEVNLLGFEDALASHLSAGQHRRIALAQLWQTPAKLWILDEPFTAIDKKGVLKLEQLIKEHANNGGAVILTTHQDLQMPISCYQKLTLEYRFF
ncbi:cytochrome c biogenesis heme-transporting ATPase CcmA [Thalassotalea hakodatensis]|uniref:cytochrome c biogenesis heme-transporting ATPase CcmA n=1 Tax=Thalassotalea hakodatensis TaxID=3030492 RepID=UPI0025735493|nr:cytochrome c biogenesis heme-transporting ATPase CcmA [Thalassotalea hakodatensis]